MSIPAIGRRPFSDSSPDHGQNLTPSRRPSVHDPFCIVLWKFSVDEVDADAFVALHDESARDGHEQPKCLFQRLTRDGNDFRVHVGLEDAYGVLTHLVSFADVLRQAGALARYRGLEIHGPAPELVKLHPALRRFGPMYVARDSGVLV